MTVKLSNPEITVNIAEFRSEETVYKLVFLDSPKRMR